MNKINSTRMNNEDNKLEDTRILQSKVFLMCVRILGPQFKTIAGICQKLRTTNH